MHLRLFVCMALCTYVDLFLINSFQVFVIVFVCVYAPFMCNLHKIPNQTAGIQLFLRWCLAARLMQIKVKVQVELSLSSVQFSNDVFVLMIGIGISLMVLWSGHVGIAAFAIVMQMSFKEKFCVSRLK